IYVDRLRNSPGIRIEGFATDDRTFGPVKAFRATAGGIECAVIMPERTVHSEIVELISKEYLRERLNLADGSRVSVEIQIKD
ncbi:Riboflavin kinase, CTP-dependent, archaeal domain protein, partial [mine drainage metagenome]